MVTTHGCLNSKEQPVAMATMFLVICSLGSCLTPVSADSPHVSPETGGLGGADREGSQSWWAAADMGGGCPVTSRGCSVTRGRRIRSCRFLWSKGLRSGGPECPGYLGPLRVNVNGPTMYAGLNCASQGHC